MQRSQSALEYMMTYGWAILIIVIVAGVLYSFGVFNPSSSASATITGFSGLGSVQATCQNSNGLVILLGNNLGKTIEILQANATTGGKTIKVNFSVTIPPDQSTSLFFQGVCPSSQGNRYSASLSIMYSEPGSVFSGPYVSSGTVSGTASAGSYVPLTITPSAATAAPFQQMIELNTTKYSGYVLNSPVNVYFSWPNGTIIPSWLESYGSPSQNATFWLKFPSGISSATSIDLNFLPKNSIALNNGTIGEAPQLSPVYGEYDNGARIFNYYTNFAGTSLPSGWAVVTLSSPGSYTVDNGILFQTGSSGTIVLQYQTSTYDPQTNIFDVFGAIETNGCMGFGMATLNNYGPCGATGAIGIMTDTNNLVYNVRSGGNQEASFGVSVGPADTIMSMWENTTGALGELNYSRLTYASGGFTAETALYPSVTVQERTVPNSIMFAQYMRIRAYPPGGVMPSVNFGSIQ